MQSIHKIREHNGSDGKRKVLTANCLCKMIGQVSYWQLTTRRKALEHEESSTLKKSRRLEIRKLGPKNH